MILKTLNLKQQKQIFTNDHHGMNTTRKMCRHIDMQTEVSHSP